MLNTSQMFIAELGFDHLEATLFITLTEQGRKGEGHAVGEGHEYNILHLLIYLRFVWSFIMRMYPSFYLCNIKIYIN